VRDANPGDAANKRELVDDLIKKAKQIEILIKSLPIFDPEEEQARTVYL
jgi:mediator of RNA polymerase II transcription subunit 21